MSSSHENKLIPSLLPLQVSTSVIDLYCEKVRITDLSTVKADHVLGLCQFLYVEVFIHLNTVHWSSPAAQMPFPNLYQTAHI